MNEVDILPPGKILVVDDNPAVADLIISLLLDNNYEVKAAKNGKEAINIAASMQPDLILLDINLPDIDGHAVCQKLKLDPGTQKIPIIFISGTVNISDKLQGLQEGAVAYLKKPFHPQEALLIIENQIINQRLKQQLEAQNKQLKREIAMRVAVEERLRLLERAIAASKNGVFVTDARDPDHPIIYVNSGFEKLTGYQASEVLGKNSRFLQEKNIRQSEKRKIKQALATNSECEVILQNHRKDGTLFCHKLTISPVNDEQGKVTHFLGIITDISAQIATEATLRERETIFQALVNGIPDLLIRMNSDGIYLDFFPGSDLKLYDSKHSQVGANVYDILPFERAQERMYYIQRALQTGESQIYEHQLTIKGEIHYEEVRIVPCLDDNILVIVRDISDRKNTEMALKQSEEYLQVAINSTGDSIFDWDIKTGKVVHLQKQEQTLNFFITNDYLEWHNRIHPEDKSKVESALTAHFSRITPQYKVEYRFLDREGSYQWILARGQAQWNETNQPIRLVGVAQKISDGKKNEAQLLAQKEFLRSIYEGWDGIEVDITEFKETEKRLRESEGKFHNVFEYAPIGMAFVGLDGKWLQVNRSICEITGYTKNELLSLTLQAITHSDDLETDQGYLELLLAGEINYYYIEKRYLHKLGYIAWILLSVSLVRDEYGDPLYFIAQIQNITERKRTEAVLHSSERIVSASTDGMCLIDRNYIYQLANQTYLNWYQKQIYQILGHHVSEIVGEEIFESIIKPRMDRCLAGEKVEDEQWFEFLTMGKQFISVTYTPYRERNGKIEGIAVSLRNLTKLKQAEEALNQSEALLKTVASNIPGCLYTVVSHLDNSISFEYISQRCQEIFEVEAEAVVADPQLLSDQIHPDDLPDYVKAVTTSKQNLTPFSQEWRHILPSGKSIWILNNCRPERQDNGEVIWHGVSLDITERKATEAKLLEAKDAAEAANLAKSTFLANMSHELRSPLNAILGFAQLLDGDRNLTSEQQENLKIIQRSGEHLLSLINSILDISKIEAGSITVNKVEFDLFQMLNELEQMFQLKATEKQLQLDFALSPNLPKYMFGDRLKLRQILINLLSNAIKFTPKGRVVLTSESIVEKEVTSECRLRFAVKDTGIGIASEELEQLFTPFFQAKAGLTSPEGTGLGLAISHKYVQFFGGNLEVDSEVGVGTTFQFEVKFTSCTFPNLENQYLNTPVVALAKDQPSYRILIVDDLAENRQLLQQLLAPLGFDTTLASNGLEAIAVCQEFQPHLILMDMKMPVMDGYEATRQIKSWAKAQVSIFKPKIIALTASALNEQKNEALAVGCDDFVSKPLETAVILEKMAEQIGVRYVFQDSTEEELSTAPESDRPPEELLKVMPQEWQHKLADACKSLNDEEIERLIAEIPPGNSNLANLLHNYAYNFAYDQILNFLESVN